MLINARAHQLDRIEDPLHRPLAQARIAVEGRGDRTTGDRAHDEPAAGPGIAEIQRRFRLTKSADADPVHAPLAFAVRSTRRAERAHCFGGVEDVLAFKQACDPGFADRQRAENQGPVRDRFVAGHAQPALEWPGAVRCKRGRRALAHGRARAIWGAGHPGPQR